MKAINENIKQILESNNYRFYPQENMYIKSLYDGGKVTEIFKRNRNMIIVLRIKGCKATEETVTTKGFKTAFYKHEQRCDW